MSKFKIQYSSKKSNSLFEKKVKYEPISYKNGDVNIETDAETELNALQTSFRQKAKAEADMQNKNTNSEFWSCIVFKTQKQRDEFFNLLGVTEKDNQYINGQKLIRALELRIEILEERSPGKFRCNKEILNLSVSLNQI